MNVIHDDLLMYFDGNQSVIQKKDIIIRLDEIRQNVDIRYYDYIPPRA